MRYLSIPILSLLIFNSCKHVPKTSHPQELINKKVSYKTDFKIGEKDTVRFFWSSRQRYPSDAFTSRNSYCKYENDSLKFVLSAGSMTVFYFKISVHEDSVTQSFWKYDCTSNTNYKPIAYNLTLDKKNYKEGDTLNADVFFKGYIAADSIRHSKNDTVMVIGKIKLKVRGSSFNYDTLSEETNLAEFYDLLRQRPDTITKVSLWNSGLTQLPNELLLFTNLQQLSLQQNRLTNADFSLLGQLKSLKYLDLQNCGLRNIPKEVMQLKNLESLNLYWNNLREIPDKLYSLTLLRELNIGYNDLNTLSPKIANLKNLESLETSSTYIRVYPDEMTIMTKLREIYPSDKMKYIPPALRKYAWGCDYY